MVRQSEKHKSGCEAGDGQATKNPRLFNEEIEIPILNPEGLKSCPLFSKSTESTKSSISLCPLFGGKQNIEMIKIVNLHLGNYKNTSIIGRICQKGDLRKWNNEKSKGTAISVDIYDGSGEISVTLFNDQIIKFDEYLKVNEVVEVCGFRVKGLDPQYQKIPDQTLELSLDFSGTIKNSLLPCPTIAFKFLNINQLDQSAVGSICDFIGIVYEDGGLHEGISQNGKNYSCRTLLVTDKTKLAYQVKVWGNSAINFLHNLPITLAIRRGKMEQYLGDKYLTTNSSSLFWVEPNINEGHEMMDWFTTTLKQ